MPSPNATPAPVSATRASRFFPWLLAVLAIAGAAVAAGEAPQAAGLRAAPALYRVIVLRPEINMTTLPEMNAQGQAAFGLDTAEGQRGFFYDGTRVHDLGTLGGPATWVNALNDAGQITGLSYLTPEIHHAFVWSVESGMIDLGTRPEGSHSTGSDINNDGVVTGTSWDGPLVPPHAFRWTAEGGLEDLGAFATGIGGVSYGEAINDAGLIAGASDKEDNTQRHAFVWRRDTGLVDIHTLPGDDSIPVAVGAGGEVAGNYVVSADDSVIYHAFLWTAATGMQDLGTAGGTESFVLAMSENAHIAGQINFPGERQHAMSWTRAGGMVDLGTLGGTHSSALYVNNKGQVVGRSLDASGQNRGFIWTAQHGMVDLNTRLRNAPAGLVVRIASAISDNGAILAESSAGTVLLKPCCAERQSAIPAPVR